MQKRNSPFSPISEDTDSFLEKPSELIEKQFIDEYFLLTRRVKGMGLTLTDFWNMDYTVFGQLLRNELDIIKAEQKEAEKQRLESKSTSKTGRMTTPRFEDSEDYVDIYNELLEDGQNVGN